MRLVVMLALLTACGFSRRAPELRQPPAQAASVVAIAVTCSSESDWGDVDWFPERAATGVVVGDGYILTAAHAVFCPTIPGVTLTLLDGHHRAAFVERDGIRFPHGAERDLARIELASAPWFGVAPPFLDEIHGDDAACIETLHGRVCGIADPYAPEVVRGVSIRKGDSGAPVYAAGELVGIVVATDGASARITGVPEDWIR